VSKVVSQVPGLLLAHKALMYIVDYLLELIIKIWLFGIFFSLKYDELGPFYFHEKSFAFVVIIFFRLKFASKRNNVPYISRS